MENYDRTHGIESLTPRQTKLLALLAKSGPQPMWIGLTSPKWMQWLWDQGYIEPSPPARFKITEEGKAALQAEEAQA